MWVVDTVLLVHSEMEYRYHPHTVPVRLVHRFLITEYARCLRATAVSFVKCIRAANSRNFNPVYSRWENVRPVTVVVAGFGLIVSNRTSGNLSTGAQCTHNKGYSTAGAIIVDIKLSWLWFGDDRQEDRMEVLLGKAYADICLSGVRIAVVIRSLSLNRVLVGRITEIAGNQLGE
jgi:hypothetical protein